MFPFPPCFNPLHCGAVVASRRRRCARRRAPRSFNPLHCGAVVASMALPAWDAAALLVSIPFIAGQWSLPIIAAYRLQRKRQVSIPFIAGQWSLQALARLRSSEAKLVSIPFIAGQWSLRFGARPDPKEAGKMSQSPSLRGSGRFSGALLTRLRNVLESQSPSLRGSGRFDSPGD